MSKTPDNLPKRPKTELKPQEKELLDFIKDTKKIHQELSTPICNTIPHCNY